MFKKFIFCTFFCNFFCNFFWANQALASEIWNSDEGLKRLEKSQFKNDFYQLANFYQAQVNQVYCSVASSVMVLNALNKSNLLTQQKFLNGETDKIKSRKIIENKVQNKNSKYDPGVSLDDLSKILSRAYHLKITSIHAEKNEKEAIDNFRQTLKKILTDKDKFLIANFDGKILGQEIKGHFSPLAAYDEESDSVLILDVALHKNQWFWTSVSDLISAMNTKDGDSYRGYLLVESR